MVCATKQVSKYREILQTYTCLHSSIDSMKSNELLLDIASVTIDLWDKVLPICKTFYIAWCIVYRIYHSTRCDGRWVPFINNTDSVELPLEKQCVKFVWSCKKSSDVVNIIICACTFCYN